MCGCGCVGVCTCECVQCGCAPLCLYIPVCVCRQCRSCVLACFKVSGWIKGKNVQFDQCKTFKYIHQRFLAIIPFLR